MEKAELAIAGNVFFEGRLEHAEIGISHGRIVRVAKSVPAGKRIDYKNAVIIPSAVDVHVHFRQPGFEHKETFATGTLSAAHGGVTAVVDMPNTKPFVTTKEQLLEKLDAVRRSACIDFGLYCGVQPGKIGYIADAGKIATAFKLFLGESTSSITTPFDELDKTLAEIAKSGRPACIHAEKIPNSGGSGDIAPRKASSLKAHDELRPESFEDDAISSILDSHKKASIDGTAGIVHICHVTSAKTPTALFGIDKITCEATTSHMLISTDSDLGARAKVYPPIRSEATRRALLESFKSGTIQIAGSDHAPHTIDENDSDFEVAPGGMPGVETMVPLMMNMVKKEDLPLGRLVEATSTLPAMLMGFHKGRISPGYDADIAVYDMKKVSNISGDKLHSKCGWTPYENFDAIFPQQVFCRGRQIITDGEFTGENGYGKYLTQARP